MEERCKLCARRREKGSDYCLYHQRAHAELQRAYVRWKRALAIERDEFLREISENPATGEWAREVAEDLLRES